MSWARPIFSPGSPFIFPTWLNPFHLPGRAEGFFTTNQHTYRFAACLSAACTLQPNLCAHPVSNRCQGPLLQMFGELGLMLHTHKNQLAWSEAEQLFNSVQEHYQSIQGKKYMQNSRQVEHDSAPQHLTQTCPLSTDITIGNAQRAHVHSL